MFVVTVTVVGVGVVVVGGGGGGGGGVVVVVVAVGGVVVNFLFHLDIWIVCFLVDRCESCFFSSILR